MSTRESPSVCATAFNLAALLQQYEEDIDDLTSTWLDSAVHARVTRRMEEIRPLCAALPMLSVASLQLLITHFELLHSLWNTSARDATQPPGACKAAHLVAVQNLRRLCLDQFASSESRVPARAPRPAAYLTRR